MNSEHQPLSRRQKNIHKGLERAYSQPSQEVSFDIAELGPLVIFSDLHRGIRDRADDFRDCERAYNTALVYYFQRGYTLALLGDVDELWQNRPKRVLDQYPRSLELEARFASDKRLWRLWGNHDDHWRNPSAVSTLLGPLGFDVPIWETLKITLSNDRERVGTIFLVHGHQGTTWSDTLGAVSRVFVRYGYRNFQRHTGRRTSPSTPASNWKLRKEHERGMYAWARAKTLDDLILITGHTHRPVFESRSHAHFVEEELAQAKKALQVNPNDSELRGQVDELEVALEWARAGKNQESGTLAMESPCFFNTGCCSFGDGRITGLEISDGKIRLVRWPNDDDKPIPVTHEEDNLESIFSQIRRINQGIREPSSPADDDMAAAAS